MLVTQDFKDFSITSWYENFKSVTPKTVIIELTAEVLKFFQYKQGQDDSSDEDSDYDYEEPPLPKDLKTELINAFNVLGKAVFVKNNWHAPLDANMFSVGFMLKAESIEDVRLFLQVSSIIQKDFDSVQSVPFCLALRKWVSIHPAAEFRCIVINNVLRGITCRDYPTFYPHFIEEGLQIIQKLQTFFEDFVHLKFPRRHYVFDVVLSYPDKPVLLDFGPLNAKTNLYAFAWKEISPLLNEEMIEVMPPVFRYVEKDIGIMSRADALAKFRQAQVS